MTIQEVGSGIIIKENGTTIFMARHLVEDTYYKEKHLRHNMRLRELNTNANNHYIGGTDMLRMRPDLVSDVKFYDTITGKEILYLQTLTIKPHVDVVSAIIVNDYGEVLLGKRSTEMGHEGYWEFPGGKVEKGETLLAAISRELREELSCVFVATSSFNVYTHEYPDKFVDIYTFIGHCPFKDYKPTPIEHDEIGWFKLEDALYLKLLPSNYKIVFDLIERA